MVQAFPSSLTPHKRHPYWSNSPTLTTRFMISEMGGSGIASFCFWMLCVKIFFCRVSARVFGGKYWIKKKQTTKKNLIKHVHNFFSSHTFSGCTPCGALLLLTGQAQTSSLPLHRLSRRFSCPGRNVGSKVHGSTGKTATHHSLKKNGATVRGRVVPGTRGRGRY